MGKDKEVFAYTMASKLSGTLDTTVYTNNVKFAETLEKVYMEQWR